MLTGTATRRLAVRRSIGSDESVAVAASSVHWTMSERWFQLNGSRLDRRGKWERNHLRLDEVAHRSSRHDCIERIAGHQGQSALGIFWYRHATAAVDNRQAYDAGGLAGASCVQQGEQVPGSEVLQEAEVGVPVTGQDDLVLAVSLGCRRIPGRPEGQRSPTGIGQHDQVDIQARHHEPSGGQVSAQGQGLTDRSPARVRAHARRRRCWATTAFPRIHRPCPTCEVAATSRHTTARPARVRPGVGVRRIVAATERSRLREEDTGTPARRATGRPSPSEVVRRCVRSAVHAGD